LQKSFKKLEHKIPTTQVPQIAIVAHHPCTTKQVMRVKCKKFQQKSKKKYEREFQEQITNVRRNQKFGQVKMCSSLQSQNLQDKFNMKVWQV
jgi:hypothetical protein